MPFWRVLGLQLAFTSPASAVTTGRGGVAILAGAGPAGKICTAEGIQYKYMKLGCVGSIQTHGLRVGCIRCSSIGVMLKFPVIRRVACHVRRGSQSFELRYCLPT